LLEIALLVGDFEARLILELRGSDPFDIPADQVGKELPHRLMGLMAFEIVSRLEDARRSRLPLTSRECPELVKPSGNGADKTPLAGQVCGNQRIPRRGRLVGPVGAAEPLNRFIGSPSGLEEIVSPLLLVFSFQAGMI